MFPFRSHPEFGWKEKMKSRGEFEHLLDVAEECGIRLFPQFNIFGHATMSRFYAGKHAVLDFNREFEPIFEPDGWSFCLSNPEARKLILDLVMELHDFYRNPPYFHIGCDEAYDYRTCRVCAEHDPVELLGSHIAFFHDRLAERGARTVMWHDMLVENGDPRWTGCIASGGKEGPEILKRLPKDIIIADWQYGKPPADNPDGEFPTSLYFQQLGFDTVVCPWENWEGTLALGRMAARRKLTGLVSTTWHHSYSGSFWCMYPLAACAAWCGENAPNDGCWTIRNLSMETELRRIGYDMKIRKYEETGHATLQVPEKNFPG